MIQKSWGLLFLVLFYAGPSFGAEDSARLSSLNMMGMVGLNTVPSARMMPAGTVQASVSRTAPYTHAVTGFQVSPKLFLGLRQTAHSSSLSGEAENLYPGLDAKFELFAERRFLPQISVGVQSAFGHKRMAGEYLALSKRYEAIDFTAGLGWGRLGSRSHLPNPLLLSHVQGNGHRELDGDAPNSPHDWFRGDVGFFGGLDYATPIHGLSFKADYSSDGWVAEKAADPDFKTPAPWSVGVAYRPWDWIDAGIAYSGGQTVMARLSFTPNLSAWPLYDAAPDTPVMMKFGRQKTSAGKIRNQDNRDEQERLGLSHVAVAGTTAEATLTLRENLSTPQQIGDAARYIANIAGKEPEQILFHVRRYGLKGVDVTLNRADLERAFVTKQGSSEEIWQNANFFHFGDNTPLADMVDEVIKGKERWSFKTDIVNDVSLSEQDSGLLYRTGLIVSLQKFFSRYFYSYESIRFNLSNNLSKLNTYRGLSALPVRGDVDLFSQNRAQLERSFLTGFVTLGDDLHSSLSAGYLDEMYMGLSTEALYRPFGKNWAIGADAALAMKRDPTSSSALLPNGDHILTGFINGYYEIPDTGATVEANIGRFLAGDVGARVALSHQFTNGVVVKADIVASNQTDADIYGGQTHFATGLHLSLPFGSLPLVPDGSRVITHAAPLGRDRGQRLDYPVPLYEVTEPLSYRHITRQWSQLMPSP